MMTTQIKMKGTIPMIIPRMGAASTTKVLFYAALIAAASMGFPNPAQAVRIYNVTTDTVLFSDDFEGQETAATGQMSPTTEGIALSGNGVQGTWDRLGSTTNAQLRVTSEETPGPYQGENYLKINRSNASNSSPRRAVAGGFVAPLEMGQEIQISFAYNWGTGGTGAAEGSGGPELQFYTDANETDRVIFMDSSDNNFHFYGPEDGYDQPIANSVTSLKGDSGVWHTFELGWVVGSADLKLKVDKATNNPEDWETITGALGGASLGWIPTRLSMSTTRAGVISFDSILPAVSAGIPGDFNGDTIVDGWDLIQWQNSYAVDGGADANGDGLSNGIDFLIWQRNFGTGAEVVAAATAVPEPGTIYLIALAVTLFSANSRRTRTGTAAHGKSV